MRLDCLIRLSRELLWTGEGVRGADGTLRVGAHGFSLVLLLVGGQVSNERDTLLARHSCCASRCAGLAVGRRGVAACC